MTEAANPPATALVGPTWHLTQIETASTSLDTSAAPRMAWFRLDAGGRCQLCDGGNILNGRFKLTSEGFTLVVRSMTAAGYFPRDYRLIAQRDAIHRLSRMSSDVSPVTSSISRTATKRVGLALTFADTTLRFERMGWS